MVYRKILVAIDDSPHTNAVFEQALELAKKDLANLMVFHCLPRESEGVGCYTDIYGRELINFSQAMQESLEEEDEQVRNWLSNYCQEAEAQGVPTECDCKIGKPGACITELASTWGADLVVLGRRGRRGLTEFVLGSVSNHVLHHAPCSVLVVQGMKPAAGESSAVELSKNTGVQNKNTS